MAMVDSRHYGFEDYYSFNFIIIITITIYNPHEFYIPKHENFTPPYTSPGLMQNLVSDQL